MRQGTFTDLRLPGELAESRADNTLFGQVVLRTAWGNKDANG
jgi:hypothetical protein